MSVQVSIAGRGPQYEIFRRIKVATALLAAVFVLIICGTPASARGVLAPTDQAQVQAVEIVMPPDAPAGFGDTLKAAILDESRLYGGVGRPLLLRAEIQSVHFKSGLGSMFGDIDRLKGTVTVVDAATGRAEGNFKLDVGSQAPSGGGSALLGILSAFDPTGLVGIGRSLAKAGHGRPKPEVNMCANFATYALQLTFGDAKAKRAKELKRQNARAASRAQDDHGQAAADAPAAEAPASGTSASEATPRQAGAGAAASRAAAGAAAAIALRVAAKHARP